jgi:hypothetical protein
MKWSITTLNAAKDAQPPPIKAARSIPASCQMQRPIEITFLKWKKQNCIGEMAHANLAGLLCAPRDHR